MATVSLCIIAGNESAFITRCLDSFKDAFDELCLVLARGTRDPDNTEALAAVWCRQHGKQFKCAHYLNSAHAREWQHVDDFSAARSLSFKLASSEWRMWADCDDVLAEGAWVTIRDAALRAAADVFFFTYVVENTGEIILRERLFKAGVGEWRGPVHENCVHDPEKHKSQVIEGVAFHHRPAPDKGYDRERNRRILQHAARNFDRLIFELHREHFANFRATSDPAARVEAMKWAEICKAALAPEELRFIVTLHQAALAASIADAKNYAWEAIRLMPWRREGFAALAQLELDAKEPRRALAFTSLLPAIDRPARSAIPIAEEAYGWPAFDLHLKALRACGHNDAASKMEAEASLSREKAALHPASLG